MTFSICGPHPIWRNPKDPGNLCRDRRNSWESLQGSKNVPLTKIPGFGNDCVQKCLSQNSAISLAEGVFCPANSIRQICKNSSFVVGSRIFFVELRCEFNLWPAPHPRTEKIRQGPPSQIADRTRTPRNRKLIAIQVCTDGLMKACLHWWAALQACLHRRTVGLLARADCKVEVPCTRRP